MDEMEAALRGARDYAGQLTKELHVLKVQNAALHRALAFACVPRLRELLELDAQRTSRGEEETMGGDGATV